MFLRWRQNLNLSICSSLPTISTAAAKTKYLPPSPTSFPMWYSGAEFWWVSPQNNWITVFGGWSQGLEFWKISPDYSWFCRDPISTEVNLPIFLKFLIFFFLNSNLDFKPVLPNCKKLIYGMEETSEHGFNDLPQITQTLRS